MCSVSSTSASIGITITICCTLAIRSQDQFFGQICIFSFGCLLFHSQRVGWERTHFATLPAAAYGVVLLMAAIAYWILQHRIIASQGEDSILKRAIGSDWKGKLSPLLYVAAIVLAFVSPWLAVSIYVLAAIMWVIPDRRIERVVIGKDT